MHRHEAWLAIGSEKLELNQNARNHPDEQNLRSCEGTGGEDLNELQGYFLGRRPANRENLAARPTQPLHRILLALFGCLISRVRPPTPQVLFLRVGVRPCSTGRATARRGVRRTFR